VVVCPASYDRVQGLDQIVLCPGARFLYHCPDLLHNRFYRFPGWLNEQFSLEFSEIVAQKIKPVVDVGDYGLLL